VSSWRVDLMGNFLDRLQYLVDSSYQLQPQILEVPYYVQLLIELSVLVIQLPEHTSFSVFRTSRVSATAMLSSLFF
jgi:hypothetical protein